VLPVTNGSSLLFFLSIFTQTSQVPALFSENFDWQHLRSDFVRGVLTSDILGKTIYTYISNDSYAARIQNSQQYDSVRYNFRSYYSDTIDSELIHICLAVIS
jgi:translation initiation factor eIF-2B subunit epsilon